MKKTLLLLLCLLLAFAAAACASDTEAPPEDEYVWEATPTDLEPADEPQVDPRDTADNEKFVEEYTEAELLLGTTLVLPDDFAVTRTLIVDETYVQTEFSYDGADHLGRYAQGLHENISGMTRDFPHDESKEIAGLSVRLRWTTAEEAIGYNSSLGVADAYDAERNISFMLVRNSGATEENLTAAMELFIQAVGAEHPAVPEPTPEPADGGAEPAGPTEPAEPAAPTE